MLDEPKAQGAIRREAAALTMLRLESVPELLDQGADERGPYLIESRLDGLTLRELVEGYRERKTAVPGNVVRLVMERSFRALAVLHAAAEEGGRPFELSHGDLAPDQLLITTDGRVSFADFGQSRWRGMQEAAEPDELGSLPFVAPELARGDHAPDQSCDVFSLAAVIAYVALGREPCVSSTPAARLVEISERGVDMAAVVALDALDDSVKSALLGALRFERSKRVRRADEVARLVQPLEGAAHEG